MTLERSSGRLIKAKLKHSVTGNPRVQLCHKKKQDVTIC